MKRINISDMICNYIKEEFISNNISFGEHISEPNLSKLLNVSRTPLREAIKSLENEGLIVRLPNGRIRMISLDREEIEELFQVRIALENTVFNINIKNENFLNALKINIEKSKLYLNSNMTEEAKLEISQFTKIIYSHIRLTITKNMLNSYNVILQKFKSDSLASNKRMLQALEEHEMIYEALANNDINLASKINTRHINGACSEIIARYF